jgi:uncharacterized protein (DUF302 family)
MIPDFRSLDFRGLALGVAAALLMAASASAEIVQKESALSVTATIDKFEAILKDKGFRIFARVDHAAGAKSVNLELRPTELLIFGNPAGGTPLMQSQQTMGLSLPLRALAWQDATGKVWLGYDAVADLAAARGVARDHPAAVRIAEALEALSSAAVKP